MRRHTSTTINVQKKPKQRAERAARLSFRKLTESLSKLGYFYFFG